MNLYKRFMQDGGAIPQEQMPQSQAPAPQPQAAPQGGQPQGGQQDPMQMLQQMTAQYAQTQDPNAAIEIANFLVELFGMDQQQAPVQPESPENQLPAQGQPQGQPMSQAAPTMKQGGINNGNIDRHKMSTPYAEQNNVQSFYSPGTSDEDYYSKDLRVPISRMLIAGHMQRKNKSGII